MVQAISSAEAQVSGREVESPGALGPWNFGHPVSPREGDADERQMSVATPSISRESDRIKAMLRVLRNHFEDEWKSTNFTEGEACV